MCLSNMNLYNNMGDKLVSLNSIQPFLVYRVSNMVRKCGLTHLNGISDYIKSLRNGTNNRNASED